MSLNRLSGKTWQTILAFAAVYIVWSSTYLAIRFALETIPPFLISGSRFTFAGTILYLLARRQGVPSPTRIEWRSAALSGLFIFVIANSTLTWAEKSVPSGLSATLYATVPLWFALLGWLLFSSGRPNIRTLIGLVMGFAGIILLVNPGDSAGTVDPFGAVLVVVSAASWAFGSLLSRRMKTSNSIIMSSGMNLLTSGIILLIVSFVTGEFGQLHLAEISVRSLLAVFYLATVSSIIAFLAYMWLLANVAPSRVATYAYVNPVFAVLLGALLDSEVLTARELFASAIIIASVVLITLTKPKAVAEEELPSGTPSGIRSRLKALAIWQTR